MKSNKELIEELKTNIAISNFDRMDASREISKGGNKVKRAITTIVTIIAILAGSITVYAAMGGEIGGKPVIEWLGLKFSDEYENYKQNIENQKITYKDTLVELTSTFCNEGITVLEFNLKLSEDDYKKLQIGENIVTEEYLQDIEERKERIKDEAIRELRGEYIDKAYKEGSVTSEQILKGIDDLSIPEDEINERYEKKLAEIDEQLNTRKNTKLIPALSLNSNQVGGTFNNDIFNPDTEWYAALYIDDTPYLVKNFERIVKVNDFEYTIYVMYLIDDEILDGKEDFRITLKDNKLVSIPNWQNLFWKNSCQLFDQYIEVDFITSKTPKTDIIDLPNDIEINVSKKDILKDSIVKENLNISSSFRNITQTVEKVVASPVQTIVKIRHQATDQSSSAFAGRYIGNPDVEYLPATRKYKVFDSNGNELNCFASANKNTLIYSDGTREDYTNGLPNKYFDDAIWERVNYLLIENANTDFIKIVPIEVLRNPVDESEEFHGEVDYEMDPLIIDLK